MIKIATTDLTTWPINRNDQPIINSVQEAYLFALLIWDNPQMMKDLTCYKHDTLANLKYERSRKKSNPKTMMHLASKAQYFRLCLDEADRIKKEMATKE